MRKNGQKTNLKKDNRGASLMIVLAAFVVLLVVAMNLLMLVDAGNRTTVQEYETAQAELYLTSAYDILNTRMEAGTWAEAFVNDQTVIIDVTGFEDGEGNAMPVQIAVTRNRNTAEVKYYITYQGDRYCITARYSCKKIGDKMNIVLKGCEELVQIKENGG